jgi:hypothetical protein
MAKVSIGIRGWRFDEDAVFDDDGEVRSLAEMPEDTRNRLIRLTSILSEPCDACWLIHGEDDIEQANQVEIVYGEPLAEVVLCSDHEPDFLYWFREEGGSQYAGTATFQEQFHEWFDDGNRAPEGYAGLDHVEDDPDSLPDVSGEDELEEVEEQVSELDEAERDALDLNLDDLDV